MTWFIADTLHLLRRHVMHTLRQPIWILVMLVQPVIWLALYGQLFRRVVELPGFAANSYIQFLTPGIVIMTALFGSFWAGMGIIEDLNEGVMDRMLATPASRAALIAARVLHSALTVGIQAIIILLLGVALGAGLPGGVPGFIAILALAMLLGAAFSAISNGAALLTRREETLIAVVNFFGLPLTFLTSAFIATALMPGWIRSVATFNPVNWAVDGARNAMQGTNWDSVGLHALLLCLFVVVGGFFATQAFRVYRRTT